MKGLDGRKALVTGVGRPEGIGAAVCRKLASEGVSIFYTYLHEYDLEHFPNTHSPKKFALELQAFGIQAECTEINLSEPGAPHKLFQAAQTNLGDVDILINNACYDRSVVFTEITGD